MFTWHVVSSRIFRKRYLGYSGYSKKHPIPRERRHIYLTEYFFMETRYLLKSLMVKKFLKIYCSETVNFDLSKTGISKNKKIGVF